MLFRNYLTSTYFHWDFFCGWCLFKYFKLCYSPAILKVLFIFWINVTQPVACFVFPKSEESQRKSCHFDTVYLLSFNRSCFVFHVQNLFAYLQVAKKCSPTFYSIVVRVFTFHVWSLLVWLLYTWEVGIKHFFFSFFIWIFIIMKTLLPALNGYLNLYHKSVGCICVFLFLDSLFCFQ